MNVSAEQHTLIIGIGNPLRSDDGLGWKVAEQLVQDNDPGQAILTVHQLTPELAQLMAAANFVVLIDANREGVPGEFQIRRLSPRLHTGAVGTHHIAPEELLALTTAIYACCPPVVMVSMTGADFAIGEQLSPIVTQKIPLLSEAVRQISTYKSATM
jgi:hydrogenase maturation protease